MQEFLQRRGLVVRDFGFLGSTRKRSSRPWSRCAFAATKWCCFMCWIREEIRPKLRDPVLLEDLETGETMEVSPDYAAHEYRDKMDAHI